MWADRGQNEGSNTVWGWKAVTLKWSLLFPMALFCLGLTIVSIVVCREYGRDDYCHGNFMLLFLKLPLPPVYQPRISVEQIWECRGCLGSSHYSRYLLLSVSFPFFSFCCESEVEGAVTSGDSSPGSMSSAYTNGRYRTLRGCNSAEGSSHSGGRSSSGIKVLPFVLDPSTRAVLFHLLLLLLFAQKQRDNSESAST